MDPQQSSKYEYEEGLSLINRLGHSSAKSADRKGEGKYSHAGIAVETEDSISIDNQGTIPGGNADISDAEYESENEDDNNDESVQTLEDRSVPTTRLSEKARFVKDRECIEAGFNVVNRMTTNDVNTLLKRLQTKCSRLDRQLYWRREVNWAQVAFGNFSADDCRLAWIYLKQTTRTYRNLRELVDEVLLVYNNDRKKFRNKLLQLLPTYPKNCRYVGSAFLTYAHHAWMIKTDKSKEPGSYCYFLNQIRREFDKLPPAERAIWEEFTKIEYDQRQAKIKEFYAQFHETPLKGLTDIGCRPRGLEHEPEFVGANTPLCVKPQHPLFPKAEYVASKIKKLEPPPTEEELPTLRTKYAEKWKTLPNATKAKWIDLFIQKCQQFVLDNAEYKRKYPDAQVKLQLNMLRNINRQELQIWEEWRKKPTHPPMSVKLLFRKLFSEQPQYKDLPKDEVSEKAFAKFNELSKGEQALYKMHYVRLHEEYKKQLEVYWASTPDVMKPASLAAIPTKFQKSLAHLVEKVSEYVKELDHEKPDEAEVVTSKEYYEVDESDTEHHEISDPEDLDIEPSAKRTKVQEQDESDMTVRDGSWGTGPRKKSQVTSGDRDDSADSDWVEIVYDDGTEAARRPQELQDTSSTPKSRKQTLRSKTHTKNRTLIKRGAIQIQPVLAKANRLNRGNLDGIIRGIMDAIPSLGSKYPPLYYYAKYVAQEKFWMKKVFTLGLNKTANLIFQSFNTLSEHQKEVFVIQSLRFHQRMISDKVAINKLHPHNRLPIRPGAYFANEPVPPPTSVERFFQREYAHQNEYGSIPRWSELDLDTQTHYMKQLYTLNQKYVQDYEKFIQDLNPPELLSYVFELYKGWERNHLQPIARLPLANLSSLRRVEVDGAGQDPSLREGQAQGSSSASTDSRPLNNDDYISWLTTLDPPKQKESLMPKRVTEPEPTRLQLKAQKARAKEVDSDEPDSDDERIGYRGGKRVGSKLKVRRALTALERKHMQDSYEKALQTGLPGLQPAAGENEN